ncbi:MAG: 23S rRNA (pseudouridine(1915)-N(3))-methyltransferase RlmH [Clostridiales bacterium]|nr:23S rRNA (pseudouridine(1915)-N(3))-methyltransferase RlmH [Clostridiales bacterium]
MKISILTVGKLKEKYFTQAVAEYAKRMSKYCTLEILEVADEKTPDQASDKAEQQIRDKEGQRLMRLIRDDAFCIALAIQGEMLDSEELSKKIENLTVRGVSHIQFVIGGSLGLSDQVLERADYHLSFSRMTFPHQLMRVILLEQIYRAFRISRNEPYHK